MRCPKCNHRLVREAKFCHECGFELSPETFAKGVVWYYEPVFVILSIFLFLGPFGLPLLWKSPRFSGWQRALLTALTILYAGFLLWVLYYLIFVILLPYYRELRDALAI